MAAYKEIFAIQRQWNSVAEWVRRGFDWRFLVYRLKWNYVAKVDHVLDFPLNVDIEVTDACNLKCIMCVHGTTGVPDTDMLDISFGKQMIDQAAAGGVQSVKFNWRGEPALHKGLEDLIRYAKSKGILEVQINTNGIPYTEERIEHIIDAGLDRVIVSMDGTNKETYEHIRVGAKFEKLMRNIKLFHDIRTRKGQAKPFIRIQMVRMQDNHEQVDELQEMWKGIADDIAVKDVTDRGQGGHLNMGDQVSIGRRRCNQPWQRMIVARDGMVYPCCSDWYCTYPIGDAKKQSLKEIWTGKPMEDLRNLNRAGRLNDTDPCKNCFVTSSYEWRKLSPQEVEERDRKAKLELPVAMG